MSDPSLVPDSRPGFDVALYSMRRQGSCNWPLRSGAWLENRFLISRPHERVWVIENRTRTFEGCLLLLHHPQKRSSDTVPLDSTLPCTQSGPHRLSRRRTKSVAAVGTPLILSFELNTGIVPSATIMGGSDDRVFLINVLFYLFFACGLVCWEGPSRSGTLRRGYGHHYSRNLPIFPLHGADAHLLGSLDAMGVWHGHFAQGHAIHSEPPGPCCPRR